VPLGKGAGEDADREVLDDVLLDMELLDDDDDVPDDDGDSEELGEGVGLSDGDGLAFCAGAMAPMRGRSDGPRVNGACVEDGPVATSTAIPAAAASATPPAATPTAVGRSAGRSPVFCGERR
jgi:hypothetical protein